LAISREGSMIFQVKSAIDELENFSTGFIPSVRCNNKESRFLNEK